MKRIIVILLFALTINAFSGEVSLKENVKINFQYEKGFLKFIHHTIQIGESATDFNYIEKGGQEILFPFERFSADLYLFKNNKISFLFQPFTINTATRFYEDVEIDNVTFLSDTIVEMKYGFPFYRLTYSYQFHILPLLEIGAGLALQLRNASITFSAANGELFTSSQNLGPVPALHFNVLCPFSIFYLYFEATGLYASSAFINGASFEFEGSLLDTSVRIGANIHDNVNSYLNIRFLGGSAKGTSRYTNYRWSESRKRYTSNYLALSAFTLGLELKL